MLTAGEVEQINFGDAIGKRYISYAMATIMSRSLPDVRDGLKPVHRRLLYAMLKLRLDPEFGFKKCARVVGDVIGKYHPHGDQAVYDALVRLAQTFSVRYPLVDGQGNFGSLDGDNAAAMRYTEAKLTEVSMLLLADIDKDTVDFKNTYDDSDSEPAILPSKFPNLLANGSEGIAVGMATSIPPHNIAELFSALIYLLKNPECYVKTLANFITGPDFPTGGLLLESKQAIIKAYETGRGSFKIRAKWHKEELTKGAYQIVITEIPYQVQKARLIEKIADLYKAKKLTLIGGIRDESDANLRVVIEPKSRNNDANLLMEQLFKFTDLENKFHLNLNVLDSKLVPRVMNLKEVLEEYIAHRYVIIRRKSQFELNKITARVELLEGYLIAYLNLDEVIAIIRESDEPKAQLIAKFNLTDNQAEAILNMRLRSLRKLEEFKIKTERDALLQEQGRLSSLLASTALQHAELLNEFEELKKEFTAKKAEYKRRTEIVNDFVHIELDETSFIEEEKVTVICSKLGWVRVVNGHNINNENIKYKIGDEQGFILELKTTEKILITVSDGKFYTLDTHKLPRGKTEGQPINMIIDLDSKAKILELKIYNKNHIFVVATKFGKGFKLLAKDVFAQTKTGKQIVNLDVKDELKVVKNIAPEDDALAVVNSNRKMLIFKLTELPFMTKGKGVILQKQISSELCDVKPLNFQNGLSWFSGKQVRTESDLRAWFGKRAIKGSLVPHGFSRKNIF
ncbi:MAG: DNA topoisomerase IV subunit A [Alphaproteobacteria bacterium]|nr:DNA topoisomerase IV subunit A [Alphaproteobacteria bacterium]